MILIRGIKGEAYARRIEQGIVDLKGIHTDSLAIVIEDSRVAPAMAFVGVY